jgi:DNA-binding FrmR family transcriptional regulator
MNTDIKFDDTKYNSGGIDRTTSTPPHNSTTIIKYITPRVITSSVSNNLQGSFSSTGWSNVNANFPPTATTYGLASLVQTPRFSTISSIHSIDGERIIDELRELSQVTETFGNTILQYCNLEAHNRAQELQIEWLKTHGYENSLIIEKMFQTEMESAQKLINESLNQKSILETRLNEITTTTLTYDEQYQQLLSKRNISNKELFDLERQIAQNNAESQFLQRRIRYFDDQMKFYILKNRILYDRKVRLRYELDDEIFSYQSLKLEVEVLENEKITNEDIHLASFDDVSNSIDISQIAGMQPSKYYSQQLNYEVQRIRDEYEKKLEIYREELHRKFELELHRYQIYKSSSLSIVTREHQFKLEQYQHENNDVLQQIAAVRGCMNQITIQMETVEKQIIAEKNDQQSVFHRKKHLDTLNQLIKDREQQFEEVFRIRNSLKEEIEHYKKRLNRYSKQKTKDYYNKRSSIHEINHLSNQKSIARLSLQELSNENNQPIHSLPHIIQSTSHSQRPKRSSIIQIEELWVFHIFFFQIILLILFLGRRYINKIYRF